MSKRRPRPDPRQLSLSLDAPPPVAPTSGALAGLDRFVAGLVGRIVKEDARSQAEIAAAMSSILDEEVSGHMLYAYASEAKGEHNISVARFLALVLVTHRADALDALAQRIGCRVLQGEEFALAQLGHVRAQLRHLQRVERELTTRVRPFNRGGQA